MPEMRTVYIVTHGKKAKGPDPAMTELGLAQVSTLRDKLPDSPTLVLCGTGRRQQDVAAALGFIPDRYSAVVGGPESLEIDGRGADVIILANGTSVPYDRDSTERDGALSMKALVLSLPNETVITTGRVALIMLGLELEIAQSGAVYAVQHDGQTIESIKIV